MDTSSAPITATSVGTMEQEPVARRRWTALGSPTNSSMGTSVWYYNGTSTQEIGLFGPGYSYSKAFTGTGGGTGSLFNQCAVWG